MLRNDEQTDIKVIYRVDAKLSWEYTQQNSYKYLELQLIKTTFPQKVSDGLFWNFNYKVALMQFFFEKSQNLSVQ